MYLVISSSFQLHCQVKRSLWFLHFIRPVFFERFVEFHRASGFTCSEELWRERSSVASFTAALPCFSSSSPSSKREVLGLFQNLFPAVHLPSTAFWTHLWLENQNATKETTKGFFAGPEDRGHRSCLVSKSFSCSSSVNSRVTFGLLPKPLWTRLFRFVRRGPDGCGKTRHLQRYWKVTSSQKSSAGKLL